MQWIRTEGHSFATASNRAGCSLGLSETTDGWIHAYEYIRKIFSKFSEILLVAQQRNTCQHKAKTLFHFGNFRKLNLFPTSWQAFNTRFLWVKAEDNNTQPRGEL